MSDDPKDKPPAKLQLSRDLKDPGEPKEVKTDTEATPDSTEATAPLQPIGETKPGFDPTNPFGDVIKESEIKKPPSPAPERLSKPAPRTDDKSAPQTDDKSAPQTDDKSGAKLEEAIETINTEAEASSRKSSLLPSIVVILILLLVIGGAGYGLWKVLQSPESTETTTAVIEKAPSEKSSKNPIEKAKEAIAKVPVADVDKITETPPARELKEAAPETIAEVVQAVPLGTIESSKQSVSLYLSGIHIGGVRKGDRPMVLIEGERFLVGDVIQPETGLKFDGIRNGRLAFRDSHGIVYLKSF